MAKAKSEELKEQAVDQPVETAEEQPEEKPAKVEPKGKAEVYRIKNPLMAHNSVYAITGARIEFDGNGVSGELDVRDFNQLKKLSGYERA